MAMIQDSKSNQEWVLLVGKQTVKNLVVAHKVAIGTMERLGSNLVRVESKNDMVWVIVPYCKQTKADAENALDFAQENVKAGGH